MKVLEGGFLPDPDGGDLALLDLGLAADADDVAVADGGSHAVSVAGQREVGVPCSRNADITLDVLLCRDGRAAGDGADQRHLCHNRQRLKARRRCRNVQPQKPRRRGLKGGGQLIQLGLGQVVDAFFQFGDGGLGTVAHPVGQFLLR